MAACKIIEAAGASPDRGRFGAAMSEAGQYFIAIRARLERGVACENEKNLAGPMGAALFGDGPGAIMPLIPRILILLAMVLPTI